MWTAPIGSSKGHIAVVMHYRWHLTATGARGEHTRILKNNMNGPEARIAHMLIWRTERGATALNARRRREKRGHSRGWTGGRRYRQDHSVACANRRLSSRRPRAPSELAAGGRRAVSPARQHG